MAESATPVPGRIFINYRREETAYPAGWLFDRLADHYDGGQVFKDIDSIAPGDDFVEVITRAVSSCDVLLALIGHEWLTIRDENGRRRLDDPHDFVRVEIEAALTRNVRVIPILVDGAHMPRVDELPRNLAQLGRRQALELSPARFNSDLGRLLRVLDTTLAEQRARDQAEREARDPRLGGEQLSTATAAAEAAADTGVPAGTVERAQEAAAGDVHLGSASGGPGPAARRRTWRRRRVWGVAALLALITAAVVVVVGQLSGSDNSECSGTASGPAAFPASFENGTDGWRGLKAGNGCTSQASDFHTDGSFSLKIDARGTENGWFGGNLGYPVDITGKSAVSVDMKTLGVGTKTAIAVQLSDNENNWKWCQTPGDWPRARPGTDRLSVTLKFANMFCPDDGTSNAGDSTNLKAVWVWFDGPGSFRMDNVRVE